MSKAVRALHARKQETLARMKALNDKSVTENREFTEEEAKSFAADKAALETINAQIEREAFVEQQSKSLEVSANASIEVDDPGVMKDPKRGFTHMGDFFATVKQNSGSQLTPSTANDERLRIMAVAPTTFGSEGAGADGGFAVPPEFSREIWTISISEDSLVPYCDDIPVQGNSMTFPKDETVPWGTDGVRAYWQAEASAATQTKPLLGTRTQRLHKLMALIPMTDELLEDTNALNAYLPKKAGASIRWKANDAILFGNGNGQPIGCLTAATGQQIVPSLVVSKDSGQATLTLSDTNLANMKAKLPPGSRRSRVWLINNDVEPSLLTLKNASGYPLYIPFGGGVAAIQMGGINPDDEEDEDAPDGRIYAMDLLISQHANTFSSQGDVNLLDLSYYQIITKAGGGIETATSMHLFFDADATAFRMLFRIDGQPKISKPISPAHGSNKLSPFLQLQAR